MALSPRHLFARRLLWWLVGVLTVLVLAARLFGGDVVLHIVEWTPMTVALLLLGASLARTVRRRL
jgi:hypothetical protein